MDDSNSDVERLVREIESLIAENDIRSDAEVLLEVKDVSKDIPGVGGLVYSPGSDIQREIIPLSMLCGSHQYRGAIREAETIARGAWAHYSSQRTKCEIKHHPLFGR